jgi:hypothetical protein
LDHLSGEVKGKQFVEESTGFVLFVGVAPTSVCIVCRSFLCFIAAIDGVVSVVACAVKFGGI